MTPADIDRVFGRGRLRMVTGDHVEVFREASLPGERRRYTKRFLATAAGDFREWTEREWRILARLVGHGVRAVPQVVQFDRGAADRPALVQTYDAGVTVDHWATLLPLERDGTHLRNVFEDCAHWWALARHCLAALDAIHALQLVHLDLKADNVCVPIGPADFDAHADGATLHARFDELALIDFAFSLVSGEPLESALPIAHQSDYEYQSPRLLRALDAGRFGDLAPTRELDWRCDLFSLAAMLWRHLPELDDTTLGGWTRKRHAKARALVRRLVEAHDAELAGVRPHAELIASASETLAQAELSESLERGWRLAADRHAPAWASPTPVTRIALPVAATASARVQTPVRSSARTPTPVVTPAPAMSAATEATPLASTTMASDEIGVGAGAAPWFFGAGDGEPLRVDPTDVDARAAHLGARRRRSRHGKAWAAGIGIAAAAAASVPFLAPEWLKLPPVRGLERQVAVAPTAPARARAADPAPSPAVERAPKTAPAAPETPAAATAPTTATPTPSSTAAPTPTAKATSPLHAPTRVAARPAPLVRTAAATPTRTPQSPSALARAARPGGAHATSPVTAAARPHLQLALAPATSAAAMSPRRPSAQRTWRDATGPIPWAVAGRPAPRLAAAAAPATTSAHAASMATPTPMQLPALARAPATAPPRSADPAIAPPGTSPAPRVAEPINVAAAATETAAAPAPFPATRARDGAGASTPSPVAANAASPDFVARANALMTEQVPRLAQQAQRSVARVLFAAGRSEHVRDDEAIRAGALAVSRGPVDPLAGMTLLPREAQQLNDAARAEYARRGSTPEALMLQVRAFGANPLDAEVAGNLAFLLLRQRPAQAEAARELALHALTLRGARNPEGRIEDWATLAIASALSGRERDARNAFLVTLALAPNLERQCKAALDVYALYGERLRGPVEAMLQSAQSAPRAQQSPLCEWPPHWIASSGGGVR